MAQKEQSICWSSTSQTFWSQCPLIILKIIENPNNKLIICEHKKHI